MKNLNLNPRLFALLALSFVLATIAGTVSHEIAHYFTMQKLGEGAILRYDHVQYYRMSNEQSDDKFARRYFIANLAGPMQTMITGTAGFLLLYFRREKITAYGMKAIDWLGVFLAFFWSRQLLNFLGITYSYITRCTGCISGGDEAKLSRYLNLPWPTINSITGTLAALILLWVVFYIIPKQQRFTFIIAGLAGSALGWLVWMEWMGPVLLP